MAYIALAISLIGSFAWLLRWDSLYLDRLYAALSARTYRGWIYFIAAFLTLTVQFAMQWSYRTALLIADSDGLRLEQTSPSAMANLFFWGRKISWADLGKVSYISRMKVLQLNSKKNALFPWAIRVGEWQLQAVQPDHVNDKVKSKNAEPDLIRVFREHGIFDAFPKDHRLAAIEFDLMGHPVTRNLLILMAVLIVYSVGDNFAQSESWVFFNSAYCLPHVIAGAFGALVFGLYMGFGRFSQSLPGRIAAGMAVMLGVMIAVASYVGGVRINQVVGGPLLEVSYNRNLTCSALVPQDSAQPVIEYTGMARAYWCSIPEKDVVKVKLRRGLFGFYQADLKEHSVAIRNYRREH
ncbi:hypothetical protein [Undibacterium sp. TJN19]|uniref:hypothetical protein n=1 Tax=Undibacterium sp. TJN19 TaxID=3413055 RepID=UPI003BF3ACDA